MALSFSTQRLRDSHGNQQVSVTNVTTDGSYAAGGFPITALQLGLTFVQDVLACNIITPSGTGTAVDCVGIPQSDGSIKLKLVTATGEVAAASNSGAVIQVVVAGY